MNKKTLIFALFLICLVSVTPNFAQESRKKPSADEAQIRAQLESTAVGWNEGSLEKYLAVYTPDATEMR